MLINVNNITQHCNYKKERIILRRGSISEETGGGREERGGEVWRDLILNTTSLLFLCIVGNGFSRLRFFILLFCCYFSIKILYKYQKK